MTKSAIVQARIKPELKKEADAVLAALGLNATTAITLFYTQLVRQRGLPLDLKVPNDETIEAMNEARSPEFRAGAKRYKNAAEMFADMDS